jgi:hypothetical protein
MLDLADAEDDANGHQEQVRRVRLSVTMTLSGVQYPAGVEVVEDAVGDYTNIDEDETASSDESDSEYLDSDAVRSRARLWYAR